MKLLLPIILGAWALSPPALAEDAREGAKTFQRYCAACHGPAADGAGPMRTVLLVQPSDLTTLTTANNGSFPLFRVVRRIDGRDPLISHGSEMPVYGEFFEQGAQVALKTESGQPIMTTRAVSDLVSFLKSVQVE